MRRGPRWRARRASSVACAKGSRSPVLSSGPKSVKASPGLLKECRSSSTSCASSSGHSTLAMRSSKSCGTAVGRRLRLRLRSPVRWPRACASGLVTGTKVTTPRSMRQRPASSSASARPMASGPATSLPCTAPSTIRRGPGRRPWNWCTRRLLGRSACAEFAVWEVTVLEGGWTAMVGGLLRNCLRNLGAGVGKQAAKLSARPDGCAPVPWPLAGRPGHGPEPARWFHRRGARSGPLTR